VDNLPSAATDEFRTVNSKVSTIEESSHPYLNNLLGKRHRSSTNDGGNASRSSPRKRTKTWKAQGVDAPEKAADRFFRTTISQQKAWPMDRMDVEFAEDETLSYTIHWKSTTFVCKSLNHLKRHERKMLEEMVTAKYGPDKWEWVLRSEDN
jgi:hypothetical protein